MHRKSFLLLVVFLTAALLTACTRERETPEATETPVQAAATPEAGSTSSEPVVERVGAEGTSTSAAEESTPEETATPTPEPEATRAVIQYTVQEGDTIASIAIRFNVSQQILRELNNLLDDNILVGQILRVPEGEPTPTPEPFKHVVQSGESLSSIAAMYGVNFLTLVEVNGLENPDALTEGTELIIPGVAAPAASDDSAGQGNTGATATGGGVGAVVQENVPVGGGELVTHVVQPGETLNSIAADYGIDAAELASANNLANPNMLRAGQQLVIPGVTQRQAVEARGIRHVIASGESLSQIAQTYGVSVEQIMAVNGIDDPNTIVVGQELIIPQ